MRNLFILLLATGFAQVSFCQTERPVSKTLSDQFIGYYNDDKYDSIFSMLSADMQANLPLENAKSFFSELKKLAGPVTARKFSGYDQGYARYTTQFEKADFLLLISADANLKINGFQITPVEKELPVPDRNTTSLQLPFKGKWTVFWGGDTEEQNYHVVAKSQKNAFDFIITDKNGNSHKGEGSSNEDYYAFEQPIIAPCNAEVVLVVDGIKDNVPGIMNPLHAGGNTVILKTINDEYLVFCHFKQQSIVVKQGQQLKKGELLGLCGNSGNSSEAHLHFHIQNTEPVSKATGIKCFFDKIAVNGEVKTSYSPVKDDIISNP